MIERLAYEPFGKRRFATGSADPNNTILPQNTDRGFTNHEHLDELTLIHMNGRVYDPVAGRFMSADPHIQDPMNLQSYNRYAYVLNNPLYYTDPSGYSWWTELRDNVVKPVVVITVAIVAAPYAAAYAGIMTGGSAIAMGAAAGATVGATAGLVYNGPVGMVKGAVMGGITGAITGGVDSNFGDTWSWQRVAAKSMAGGVSSEIQGGQFKDGFRSSFATSSAAWLYTSTVYANPAGKAANPMPGEGLGGVNKLPRQVRISEYMILTHEKTRKSESEISCYVACFG